MKDNLQQLLGFLGTEPGRSLESQSQLCSLLDRGQQFTVHWSKGYILLFQSVKHLGAAEWGQNKIIGAMRTFPQIYALILEICSSKTISSTSIRTAYHSSLLHLLESHLKRFLVIKHFICSS